MKYVRIEFLPETFGRYRLKRIDGEEDRYSKRMEVDEESSLAPQCSLSLPMTSSDSKESIFCKGRK